MIFTRSKLLPAAVAVAEGDVRDVGVAEVIFSSLDGPMRRMDESASDVPLRRSRGSRRRCGRP